jgi:hypothetical protein
MKLWPLMLHPKPELVRFDTSLRYTDILFGFVIREIFLRLQYWQNLNYFVLLHLSVSLALVLGSWIGYRRSLNRTSYEVKFFNLPFFRFLLDQGMLILYFQIAGLTSVDLGKPITGPNASAALTPDPQILVHNTMNLLVIIFILYLAWDLLGIWMAKARVSGKPRYSDPRENFDKETYKIKDDTKPQRADVQAVIITGAALVFFIILLILSWSAMIEPRLIQIFAIILLLLYRLAKETKTSWVSTVYLESDRPKGSNSSL